MFFINMRLETITMVESQWAYRAREVYSARSSRTTRIEVHAINVLLQTVSVQVHVITERTPDIRVCVQFPSFRRRTDTRRWAGGRMYVSLCYVIRQFVFGQKRFTAYLTHCLRSQRHIIAAVHWTINGRRKEKTLTNRWEITAVTKRKQTRTDQTQKKRKKKDGSSLVKTTRARN